MNHRARFSDRVCLVTGSTGMAAAAARAIANEEGSVFVASRNPDHCDQLARSITEGGGRAAWRAADLAEEADVDSVVRACVDTYGRLDVVYNIAGISGRKFGDGPLHECSLAAWETVQANNARSTFLVCRASVRSMLGKTPDETGQRGAILNMSSALASHPSANFFATHAYAASKGAVESFSRAIASYYAPMGIRVNVIAPALIATPMSLRAQGDPATMAYLAQKQPLARGAIEAGDVVGTALFLLSADARMVTGQVVAVDGGWAVSEPRSPAG